MKVRLLWRFFYSRSTTITQMKWKTNIGKNKVFFILISVTSLRTPPVSPLHNHKFHAQIYGQETYGTPYWRATYERTKEQTNRWTA